MMAPFRVAVFASGSGSNFQAILDAARSGELDVSVELLVCDRPKAKVVERAQIAGVETFAFRPKDYESREQYETEIAGLLRQKQIDLVVLAGYMRIVGETLLKAYEGRIINIHPSLLPSFPGLDAIGQALRHGVKVTGVTVHFVDGGMDTGPIIAQRAVEIAENDTEETLAEKIHAVEHALYPYVIQQIRKGRVSLSEDGRRAIWNETILT
jgi:phosphoribosylglycinamide formyltransferase-1